jgi:uncharacterized protein YegL
MFDPKKFVVPRAKPLPVCLLPDTHGSMQGSKINHLNQAVKQMLSQSIKNTPHSLFFVEYAIQLHEFFRYVSMSTSIRVCSKNPDVIPDDIDKDLVSQCGAPDFNGIGSAKVVATSDDGVYW